jgi:predicted TIM-barrel fold metal-dependent hydrolase
MTVTVDVHQHLWPSGFVGVLRSRRVPPLLDGSTLVTVEGSFPVALDDHDPERRIALLDRDGIDVAVLSLQPSLGLELLAGREREELELAWADGARALVRESAGRFRALAPWRRLEGFAGTSVGASALVDPRAHADLLDEIDTARGLVFVHPESEGPLPAGRPDWWAWTAGYTGQMQRAYLAWLGGGRERWPRLRIVFAILAGGAPIQHERLVHRGVDVRGTLDPDTLFETATYGRRAIELVIETFGVERVLYGSDTPVVDSSPTLGAVRGMGDSVARLLQADNPERVLA